MPTALDVAQYILETHGAMTVMKLQKLVYYSQAWSIVWDDDVLFQQKIEAWDNGPVVRSLWEATRGNFRIDAVPNGNSWCVTSRQRETINKVLNFYGGRDAQWLSDLTHMEDPWQHAYNEGKNAEITPAALSEYYSSLRPA